VNLAIEKEVEGTVKWAAEGNAKQKGEGALLIIIKKENRRLILIGKGEINLHSVPSEEEGRACSASKRRKGKTLMFSSYQRKEKEKKDTALLELGDETRRMN